MQISTLLRLKHCLQSHIESTLRNEFKRRFSHFIYSRWRRRKQCSSTKIMGELRSILRLRWTALNTNWCKKMRIYNAALKNCQVYSHNSKETCIKFPAISGKKWIFWNFWWWPEVTGHYKNVPPPYLRKKLLSTGGNLEVNEQSKCKSVPVFFYSKLREKARNMQSLNFWAYDINRKSRL